MWGTDTRDVRHRHSRCEAQTLEMWGTDTRDVRHRHSRCEAQTLEMWGTNTRDVAKNLIKIEMVRLWWARWYGVVSPSSFHTSHHQQVHVQGKSKCSSEKCHLCKYISFFGAWLKGWNLQDLVELRAPPSSLPPPPPIPPPPTPRLPLSPFHLEGGGEERGMGGGGGKD